MLSRTRLELFLLSFVSLFLELLVIRWLAADIKAFSVLKSFPLAACCIGLGVGCSLPNDRYYRLLPLSLLAFAVLMAIMGASILSYITFPSATYNWGSSYDGEFTGHLTQWLYYFAACTTVVVGTLAAPFLASVAIGSRLGELFRLLAPLSAYSINVAGALLGTVVFAGSSFLNLSPAWQLAIPSAYATWSLWPGKDRWKVAITCLAAVIVAVLAPARFGGTAIWSPYQRIDIFKVQHSDNIPDYLLWANGISYQIAHDLRPSRLRSKVLHDDERQQFEMATFRHNFPYLVKPDAGSAVIFGSGIGNDVASAVRANVRSITAVELDPVILDLGKKYHPEHPYQSPKVITICDDGRHFANTTHEKYDLVVFSHLDSHSVLSQSSAIRLDNFIYTRESIERAMKLLKSDGLLVVSFCTTKPWFAERIYQTMFKAAGYRPAAYTDTHSIPNTFFILGQAVEQGKFKLPVQLAATVHPFKSQGSDRILTDDWPFLYLAPVSFDIGYVLICLEILAVCAIFAGKMLRTRGSFENWQLFFLGAGFILLELQAIARISVLLGTTWLTSSVVISGVLLMILLANLALMKFPELCQKTGIAYALLFVSLLISYNLPVSQIIEALPRVLACCLVCGLTVLPLLCAAIIFGSSFARVKDSSIALSFNLMGTVIGSLLEYGSNYTGIANLLILAACLYLASFLLWRSGHAKSGGGLQSAPASNA